MSLPWLGRWASGPREVGRGLLQLAYPACCHLCERSILAEELPFCDSCRAALFTDPLPSCPHCAASVGPYSAIENNCVHCRREHFPFEAVVRLGPYDGLLRETVLRLKYHTGEGL